jgi:DNA-binding MarR family transcriptional regulator
LGFRSPTSQKKLRADPSFVTAQTKLLEKAGHVRRVPSKKDGRVVLMSFSDRARKQIANLKARQQALAEFLLSDLGDAELNAMLDSSKKLERRFAKALHLLAINE